MNLVTTILGRRVLEEDWIANVGDRVLKLLADYAIRLGSLEKAQKIPMLISDVIRATSSDNITIQFLLSDLSDDGMIEKSVDACWITREGLYVVLNAPSEQK